MIKATVTKDQTLEEVLEQHWVENTAAVLKHASNQELLEQFSTQGEAEGELTLEPDMLNAPSLEEDEFYTFVLLPKELQLDLIVANAAGVLKPDLPYQLVIDEDTRISGTTDADARLTVEFETHESVGLLIFEDEFEGTTIRPVKFTERPALESEKGIEVRLLERSFAAAPTLNEMDQSDDQQYKGLIEYWATYTDNLA